MSKKYYIYNFFGGLLCFIIHLMIYWDEIKSGDGVVFLFIALINTALFPFSKRLIENIALKYTKRDFWNRGFFMDTPGKMGGVALYYLFCFIFSIPFAIIFITYYYIKKAG